MTSLVARLRNIAAAKSRPMERAACIETEAADAIESLVMLKNFAHHWDECEPAMTGACVCGLDDVLRQCSGFKLPSSSIPTPNQEQP